MAWLGWGGLLGRRSLRTPPRSCRASGLKLVSLLGGHGAAHFFPLWSAGWRRAEETPRSLPMKWTTWGSELCFSFCPLSSGRAGCRPCLLCGFSVIGVGVLEAPVPSWKELIHEEPRPTSSWG